MITFLFMSIAKCSNVTCQNNGKCSISVDGDAVCSCTQGYQGATCSDCDLGYENVDGKCECK